MDEDRSFLYGDGLFETVRVEKGQVRFLERHRARLRRSASVLGFEHARVDEACTLLGAPGGLDGLWRVTISRDGEGVAFGGSGRVSARWRAGLPDIVAPRLVTMPGFYFPGDALAEHKTTSWVRSVELRRRAHQQGFDDGIGVSLDGRVGECSAANLFVLNGEGWMTPPVDGLLPGVTRAVILQRAVAGGIVMEECEVTLEVLKGARAIALTSAGLGVVGASAVDGRELDPALADELKALLEGW